MTVQLTDPFPREAIGKLPRVTCGACSDKRQQCGEHKRTKCRTCKAYVSTQHVHIDYVGHAHVTERLLAVDPGWTWEPMAVTADGMPAFDNAGGLWIRLTVNGVTRIGYGDADGRQDSGLAVKIAIGDALRNAAMRFGVALDLWKKEPAEVSDGVPSRQVERPAQTEEQRKTELRGQVAVISRNQGRAVEDAAAHFYEWSRGRTIQEASVALLAEYREHLQNPSGGSS